MRDFPLSFAESRQQLETLVKYRQESGRDVLIISVNPEADYFSLVEGEPDVNIEDFYSPEELNQAGDENIKRVEAFAESFDRLFHRVASGAPLHDWVSLRSFFHPLKGFFDSISLRLLPVLKAFREFKPQSVVCFEQPPHWRYGPSLMDKPGTGLTARLLPLVAQSSGCETIWLREPLCNPDDPYTRRVEMREPTADTTVTPPKSALLKQALKGFLSNPGLTISRIQTWAKAKFPVWSPVLIQAVSADIPNRFLDYWQRLGANSVFSYGEIFPEDEVYLRKLQYSYKIGSALWARMQEDAALRQHLFTEQIDWSPLMAPLLRTIALEEIPDLLAFAPVAAKALARFKRAVIVSGGMVGRNSIICKAAAAQGIPVVSIHYGGYIGYCDLPMHERYDLAGADYFVCGGRGAAEALGSPSPLSFWKPGTKRAKPVPIGNAWLEDLMSREKVEAEIPSGDQRTARRTPVIMYVMAALVGDNRYLGYVFYPEIWYYRFQRQVIESFAKFPDVRFLLKPPLKDRYPQINNPNFDWLDREGPSNVEVMEDIPLSQVLHRADAFILDQPATPLPQILMTGKPALVYADRRCLKFVPRAAELLRQGGTALAESEEEFFQELDNFLSQDVTSENPLNEEFLKMYATHVHDGRSSERLAAFLHLLARGEGFDEST